MMDRYPKVEQFRFGPTTLVPSRSIRVVHERGLGFLSSKDLRTQMNFDSSTMEKTGREGMISNKRVLPILFIILMLKVG